MKAHQFELKRIEITNGGSVYGFVQLSHSCATKLTFYYSLNSCYNIITLGSVGGVHTSTQHAI